MTALLCAALASATLPACSGAQGPKSANVTAGDMPAGGDWSGVYYSELFGFLHLIKEGNSVTGKWIRPGKDKWGELNGTATGNLIRFSWVEYVVGSVGPGTKREGRGYLRYVHPEGENVDDQLLGEVGPGMDEVGTIWDAIKQRNVLPDLSSIGGGGNEVGGDWDAVQPTSEPVEPPATP